MPLVAALFAIIAGLAHVGFFTLESVTFSRPEVWARFHLSSQAEADIVRPMALNQGFYNLFLAIVTAAGVALVGSHREAGVALLCAGTGSMLAAALVLITSDRSKARAAVVQGLFPALSLLCLLVWSLT
jgi:putative membrane protein